MNAWRYFEAEFIQNIYGYFYAPIAFSWGKSFWYPHCRKSSQSCMHSGCNVEGSHWMLVVQQVRLMLLIVKILRNVAM